MRSPEAAAPQETSRGAPAGTFRSALLLIVLCAPVFLYNLGRPGLGDPDEGRNAEAGREMLQSGDWVTPRLDGVVYLDKPPAFFWAVAVSLRIFGVSELSARLPSALFALAGIVLVFSQARRRLGEPAGLLAGLTLALSPLYIVFGRIVIFDMMLNFCMTVAVLAAFEALESERSRILPGALFFAATGVGTICKGPVALVVPLLVALAWSFVRRRPRSLSRLRFGIGLPLYVAIILPWLWLVEARNPGYLHYALIGENLERMTSNRFETARPFYFYAKVILPGLFPWIVLCTVAGWRRAREFFSDRPLKDGWRDASTKLAAESDSGRLLIAYAVTWLTVLILFFSLIASKRPSYMLPCAVPLALLNGQIWSDAIKRRRDESVSGGALQPGLVAIAVLCVAGAVATCLARLFAGVSQGKYDPLLARSWLFGGTAMALLGTALLLLATRRLRRPILAFATSALSIAVVVPLAHAASGYLDEARSSRPVSRYLAARLKPDDLVVCYEQYRPGLNFYLRRPIHLVTSGTPFSSWYVKAHIEELSRDPGFPIISSAALRRLLEAPTPDVYLLVPRRMYERMHVEAGPALRPDPIYEDLGAGLFVRGGPGVLSFSSHRCAGPGPG